jgi:hypothetical protein
MGIKDAKRGAGSARQLYKGLSVAVLLAALWLHPTPAESYSKDPSLDSPSIKKKSKKKPKKSLAPIVREAEQLLADLGYWTGPVDGKPDTGSRHALIAFQKVEGRSPTGRFTTQELEALRTASTPQPLQAGPFHVEVDLARQVLFIVDEGGTVSKILPVSSGNNKPFMSREGAKVAVTPCGRLRVGRKISGWRKSELGLLYYPSYIVGGVAIHGSPSVPVRPASHGCIRIPMYASVEFSEMAPVGTPVIVHGCVGPGYAQTSRAPSN